MMMYKHMSILLALSFLAGKVVAQGGFTEDYTLTNPDYQASVANGVMTFTGVYDILSTHSAGDYNQIFTALVGGECTTSTNLAVASPPTFLTAGKVTTVFTLTLSSPVYTTTDTGGDVALCHRIELTKNGLLVNVVDTKITVNLSANFVAVAITTSAAVANTEATGQVDLASTVTATASKTTVTAGQPITITVTSTSYDIESITAKFSDTLTVIPKSTDAPLLASTPVCTSKQCVFDLNLGIAFFKSGLSTVGANGAAVYNLSGTAKLKLGARRHLQDQEDAPFTLQFYEAPDDAASSAVGAVGGSTPRMFTMTFAAAGGLVAALAVV
jgi:hypothetical protein